MILARPAYENALRLSPHPVCLRDNTMRACRMSMRDSVRQWCSALSAMTNSLSLSRPSLLVGKVTHAAIESMARSNGADVVWGLNIGL